jgi:hypothetical protein
MSYDSVETGLRDVIRKITGYTATDQTANVTKGDYRCLGFGVTKAVILTPGSFQREVVAAPRRLAQTWTVNLELWLPFRNEVSDIASDVRTARQVILDEIDKWPRLDGTTNVLDAFATGGQEPIIWQGENRRWWTQMIPVIIKERTTVTMSE